MQMISEKTERYLENRSMNPKQKEFFDERADVWDDITVHDRDKVERIARLLGIHPSDSILDVGTGTGVMIPYYLERLGPDGRITAVDYSPKMISRASSKYPPSDRLSYIVSDVCSLHPGPRYDIAVCYCCFPHFPDPLKAARAIAATLRDGGMLWIAHSSSKNDINRVHESAGTEVCRDYLPDADVMKEILGSCGIKTVFSEDDAEYYIVGGRKTSERCGPQSLDD
jgi:demethylmenaquinone methyltransferase/2-methoxy-6-polyprenyl-1,4-benzoquinol methylase